MSEAACKTILCSGGARASVLGHSIAHETEQTTEYKLAVNAVVWELQNAVEVTHLLVEQKFKIGRDDAYKVIAAADVLERDLLIETPMEDAIILMKTQAQKLHEGILHLHLTVTGESADYQIH